MLQVVNLTKVYKVKGGVETRALDGVNLTFPEKGMVFLLGKSGSGKSTLLNVCGGLDNPTSGEIIVKGRSSKDFSQGDFDSYRNTFVGFVFQEYNILNEFSVEDNIALALELQGKPKDRDEITKLLHEVDLDGYAKRKPNTLSGGQKQRIAIARALIKSPEIIMADEPTGALDSNTGKQVFETLKKLSANKLVIVVSHDRDFAEQYGDRIIELKDGKVLSDVSKGLEEQKEVGDGNVSIVGGNTLCVNDGDSLTEGDYQFIRDFLKGQKGAIITSGQEEIDSFKRVNRITAEGQREVFVETDESAQEKKSYTAEDSKFIRSRLPLKRAIKIGVSGLKTKPIRLIFTILLCIISFTMFGLFSTLMLYDKEATLHKSVQDSTLQYLVVRKEYEIRQHNTYNGEEQHVWKHTGYGRLTQAEIDETKQTYGNDVFGAVETGGSSVQNVAVNNGVAQIYQELNISYIAALPEGHSLRSRLLAGRYPTAEDEICISEYVAQCLIQMGFNDEQTKPNSLQEVVGKILGFQLHLTNEDGSTRTKYKIVGVFDDGFQQLISEYPVLSEDDQSNIDAEAQRKERDDFQQKYTERLHGVIFVCDSALQKEVEYQKWEDLQRENPLQEFQNESARVSFSPDSENGWYYVYYGQASRLKESIKTFGKRAPATGEMVVTYTMLEQLINGESNSWEVRNEIIKEVIEQVNIRTQAKLDETGYSAKYDEWNYPTQENDPEMYDVMTKYVYTWNDFESNYANENGWFGGYGLPQTESDHCYEFYQEIFLPVWTEGGENSYQARYRAATPIREERLKIPELSTIEQSVAIWVQSLRNGEFCNDEGTYVLLTEEQKGIIANAVMEKLSEKTFQCRVMVWSSVNGKQMLVGDYQTFKVVGIIDLSVHSSRLVLLDDTTFSSMQEVSKQYLDNNYYTSYEETKYEDTADAWFHRAFLPYDHSDKQTEGIRSFSLAFSEEDDSRIVLCNAIAQEVNYINETVDELSLVFMWVGIVLAVFSALLLSNFISVSIANKKKEIGILRAVGARGTDVFKIFFAESLTIAIICTVISLAISIVGCGLLNTELGAMLSGVSLFVFGPISIAILLGVAIGTAAIATFLPVYLAARKKPVDSIRAL